MPYLSSVYFGLVQRTNKDYIGCQKAKLYLNMPEYIGQRIVEQINANGDERIDHDEFVKFFLTMLMGTLEQKMQIAFKCYDMDGDEQIEFSEISIILKNIPSKLENRYGSSFTKEKDSSRTEYLKRQEIDNEQIDTLMSVLEKNYEDGMYFDEFIKVAKDDTSELFVSIFNCIYECVPCVKNFFIMRAKYS